MMIGREAEVAEFDQVLAGAQPALIVVTSEPAMGKSSLLREFRRRARARERPVLPLEDTAATPAPDKLLDIDSDTTEKTFLAWLGKRDSGDRIDYHRTSHALILIDGYRPSSAFEAWFREDYLPNSKDVVVVASNRNDVQQILPVSTLVLDLKALPEAAVLEYLQQLDQEISLNLTDEEFKLYTPALCRDPRLFTPLRRLLQQNLARATAA